jgi:hypothetical protein
MGEGFNWDSREAGFMGLAQICNQNEKITTKTPRHQELQKKTLCVFSWCLGALVVSILFFLRVMD